MPVRHRALKQNSYFCKPTNQCNAMERLDVFDCSDILIASYFSDDRGCAHENREHTLIYICSGMLEIDDKGTKTVLKAGDCAFMRRDNRMWLQKHIVGPMMPGATGQALESCPENAQTYAVSSSR